MTDNLRDPGTARAVSPYDPQLLQQIEQAYAAPVSYPQNGVPVQQYDARACGQKRGPWAVWWLSLLTFGIYYLVWYYKINKELAAFAPHVVQVKPGLAVLAQCIPVANLVSLAHTARRLNAAHGSIGSPVRASAGLTVLAAFWYSSHPRYLQRRMNALWDAATTLHVNGR